MPITEHLTPDDFGPARLGVHFYEDEDGDLWAYGHVPPADMIAAVAMFYASVSAPAFDLTPPGATAVQHCYAVRAEGPRGGDEGPYMSIRGVTAETPGAIPATYVHI